MPGTQYTPETGTPFPSLGDGNYATVLQAGPLSFSSLTTVGGGCVKRHETPSASLRVDVNAASYRKSDGTIATYTGVASQLLTDNATNYLYLTDSGALTISTSAFPVGVNYVPLAIATTLTGVVTNVADARIVLGSIGRAGPILTPTIITTATATLTASQCYVQVNRAGAVALILPAASTIQPGASQVIHDISGAAAANNITTTRAGADTINGGTANVISTNYGGVKLWCDGVSAWFILP